MLWQMCTGLQPFQGLHAAHILYGKQTGSLSLQWPIEIHSPIRKLGELCTAHDETSRPNFDQICKALVQIELRLQRMPRLPPTPTATEIGGDGTAAMVCPADPSNLMPDPDLLM